MSEKKSWKVWNTAYPDEGADIYENATREEVLELAIESGLGEGADDLGIREATEDEVEASHAEP